MNIYTTKNSGRLHIAQDENYLGSVNSYNNRFTRFFASLFHLSITIQINEKSYFLNKKSYNKFLKKWQIGSIQSPIKASVHTMMRNKISKSRVEKLTKKLVSALFTEKLDLVKKYVGKGADLDQLFWYRDNSSSSFDPKLKYTFDSYDAFLPSQPIAFKARSVTPVAYAALMEYSEIVEYMLRFQPKLDFKGKVILFSRSFIKEELDTFPRVYSHYARFPSYFPPPKDYQVSYVKVCRTTFHDSHAENNQATLIQESDRYIYREFPLKEPAVKERDWVHTKYL